MTVRRIDGPTDPWLPAWLDLYQVAFPIEQQLLVSGVLQAVGPNSPASLVMAGVRGSALLGLAWMELQPAARTAALWYLAVVPALRGRGLGRRLLDAAIDEARAATPGLRLVGLEVERPDLAPTDEERTLRQRRIAFYQRAGYVLRDDIPYVQCTGWQPPVPMHLMALPIEALTPEEQHAALVGIFGLETTTFEER